MILEEKDCFTQIRAVVGISWVMVFVEKEETARGMTGRVF
jgi:hypothetical protein